MPVDLMVDKTTRDMVSTPSGDVAIVTGDALTQQRMRVRIFVQRGSWALDPSDGQLGGSLSALFRMNVDQAASALPLLVREALAPMADIRVDDVQAAVDEVTPGKINFTVYYTPVTATAEGSPQQLTTSVEVA